MSEQLLPPAVNTLPVATDPNNLDAIQAYVKAKAQADALRMNENLKTAYLDATFANWFASYDAGRLPYDSTPPAPPKGFMVQPVGDGWGYDFVQVGPPVCDVPTYPKGTPPQVHVNFPGNESVMSVPVGDTMPTGFVATAPDGSKWEKRASTTPFGVAHYYAKIG